MMISLKWISDFVDVSDYFSKPQELADLLTAAGLEVEGIKDPSRQFQNVVIGKIIEKDQHPNADRLTLCQVDVGDGSLKQIVCGAKNHSKGDKVVVALPGAVLPGDFAIKLSKIRGIESSGMLSSESELGLSKESEGILILPSEAPVGQPFADYQGLNDVILEINVTPNRADCLSHYGLAREISALLGRPLKGVEASIQSSDSISVKSKVKLSVLASQVCPRYSARYISQVKVGPSPEWIRQRLEAVGMNSINNVVDITNYVMLELGQPLHAFDADQLSAAEVIVDLSKKSEKFVTLDGTEIDLSGEELTIRDASRAVCLAGVVGGKNSGVSESTSNIFLESAHFSMESVRKTSRRHGLQTDSAYRFSRGTDISNVILALNRAAHLLQKEAGGVVSGDHYDIYPNEKSASEISVSYSYVSDRLGYPVEEKNFNEWMKRLGCELLEATSQDARFRIPLYRQDLERDVDLVEEYGRLNGYDRIPEVLPVMDSEPLSHDESYVHQEALSSTMVALGYRQAINYGFTSSRLHSQFLAGQEAISLKNPLSEELNEMRLSLLPGLIQNLFFNFRYGNHAGRLFEVGSRFLKKGAGFQEDQMLAILAWGQSANLWNKKQDHPLFFEVKSALEQLFQKFPSFELRPWQGEVLPFLHPGQSAHLFCEGKSIGFIGSLHPGILEDEKINVPAVVVELDTSTLKRRMKQAPKIKAPGKFQGVERDLTFLAQDEVSSHAIRQVLKKAAGALLEDIDVMDEFRGGDIPPGYKSLSFRMLLRDEAGTLTDQQLLELQKQMIDQVEKKLSVKLR